MKDKSMKTLGLIAIFAMIMMAIVAAGCTTQETATPTATPTEQTPQGKAIVDFADRSVTLPDQINRITSIHPITTYILWRLAPEKMTSIDKVFQGRLDNATWAASDLAYLRSLPVIPAMPQNPSKEQILATTPDVIVTLTKDGNLNTWLSLGMPVVEMSKDNLTDYVRSIRIMGTLTGETETAEQMATFWQNTIDKVTSQTTKISTHPKVLYYNGNYNSTTVSIPAPATVFASEITLAGGVNYYNATDPRANPLPLGMNPTTESIATDISYINAWNPDVIICTSNATAAYIMAPGSPYRDMNAVKNGRVYTVPKYESMDGVTSIMGFEWLASKLYPDQVNMDFVSDTKAFYKLFQKVDITTDLVNMPTP
jgi:ABC-type Fe3+-hydroxamate transport system, periplasmic component